MLLCPISELFTVCRVVQLVVCVDSCRKLSCALLMLSSELNSQVGLTIQF